MSRGVHSRGERTKHPVAGNDRAAEPNSLSHFGRVEALAFRRKLQHETARRWLHEQSVQPCLRPIAERQVVDRRPLKKASANRWFVAVYTRHGDPRSLSSRRQPTLTHFQWSREAIGFSRWSVHSFRSPRLDDGYHRGAVVPRPPGLPCGRRLRRLLPCASCAACRRGEAGRRENGPTVGRHRQGLRRPQVPHHRSRRRVPGADIREGSRAARYPAALRLRQNIHATARLERFWRTLKDAAELRLRRPLTIQDLERRLEIALAHYVVFRPHQGLHGATPAEALLGVHPACANALSPPRGRPGEGSGDSPFCVEYLDPRNRRFPVLKSAA